MAAALGMSPEQMGVAVRICKGAWISQLAALPDPDHPGYWRLVLKDVYAHPHRRGESDQEGRNRAKRVNINIEVSLHNAFKAATAAKALT